MTALLIPYDAITCLYIYIHDMQCDVMMFAYIFDKLCKIPSMNCCAKVVGGSLCFIVHWCSVCVFIGLCSNAFIFFKTSNIFVVIALVYRQGFFLDWI